MGEDVISQVSNFKYQGLILQNDGKINTDVMSHKGYEWKS